jgi:hypothetical protein
VLLFHDVVLANLLTGLQAPSDGDRAMDHMQLNPTPRLHAAQVAGTAMLHIFKKHVAVGQTGV